jgi:hypothetical protein
MNVQIYLDHCQDSLDTLGPDISGLVYRFSWTIFKQTIPLQKANKNYTVDILLTIKICPDINPDKIWTRAPWTVIQL